MKDRILEEGMGREEPLFERRHVQGKTVQPAPESQRILIEELD